MISQKIEKYTCQRKTSIATFKNIMQILIIFTFFCLHLTRHID